MTHEERIALAKEWHNRYVTEYAGFKERLERAANRLKEIRENTLYRILPSWIRDKIEEILS